MDIAIILGQEGEEMSDTNHHNDLLTIQGIMIASDWNKEGDVIRIAIMTDDEEEFFILKNKYWDQLLAHLREPVKILGVIDFDDDERGTITVISFEPIEAI
ncbi:MAG: hypothetical protein JW885_01315 [Deltaproteobacteria bacterium]|nr:hypothetical protein [Candidatus Zymogenaceae bacterium]